MTTITAKSILRSRCNGKTLSTLLLRYPRFIHAELMTHRAFSRNAASSRAIPFEKQLQAMLDDPAVPLWWGADERGMVANGELSTLGQIDARSAWLEGMQEAITTAERLHSLGLHKQIVNRVIEPFTHITVLVSATEWDNFLELRDHPDAEPHMAMLARKIRRCLEYDSVQELQPGEWHLPFTEAEDEHGNPVGASVMSGWPLQQAIRLSVGRCASTSYKTVDGFDMTLERATKLHDQFVHSRPQHASPLEHVACADSAGMDDGWMYREQHGNFVGWRQYRFMVRS